MKNGRRRKLPVSKPRDQWLIEVKQMFDTEMISHLHGRLLILSLCRIDNELKKYLESQGFYQPLADELREDFESLLLPEYAGDQRAYRRVFMKLLQMFHSIRASQARHVQLFQIRFAQHNIIFTVLEQISLYCICL